MSADVDCGMVSGTLASGAGVMLSGDEVRIDLIELRDFHRRPGFDRTLGGHAPEGWAIVCWPRLTLLNSLSRTDWDPGGRYAQAETMGTITLVIFDFHIRQNGI